MAGTQTENADNQPLRQPICLDDLLSHRLRQKRVVVAGVQLRHMLDPRTWLQSPPKMRRWIGIAKSAGNRELEYLTNTLLGPSTDVERAALLDLPNDLQDFWWSYLMHHELA